MRSNLRYRVPGLASRDVEAASSRPRLPSPFVWRASYQPSLPECKEDGFEYSSTTRYVWGGCCSPPCPQEANKGAEPIGGQLFGGQSRLKSLPVADAKPATLLKVSVGRFSPLPGTKYGALSPSTDSLARRRGRQAASALHPFCPNFGVPPPPEPANPTGFFHLPRLRSAGFLPPLTEHRALSSYPRDCWELSALPSKWRGFFRLSILGPGWVHLLPASPAAPGTGACNIAGSSPETQA